MQAGWLHDDDGGGAIPVMADDQGIFIPVSRDRAALRAIVRLLGALVFALPALYVVPRLRFTPSGVSNRIEDYALAFVALVLSVVAAWLAFAALRWLCLACWPGRLGFWASERDLILRLGPFGHRMLDADRLDAVYLFELDESQTGHLVEAFLPPNVQRKTLLPRLRHPEEPRPLRTLLLDLAAGDEEDLAAVLGPIIERWRGERRDDDSTPAA